MAALFQAGRTIFSGLSFTSTALLMGLAATASLTFVAVLACLFFGMDRKIVWYKAERLAGTRLDQFEVEPIRLKGGEENALEIRFPRWRYMTPNGQKAKRLFNRRLPGEAILRLGKGKEGYLIWTNDLANMVILVSVLRRMGHHIPPCEQERAKYESLQSARKGIDQATEELLDELGTDDAFANLVKTRMSVRGSTISDAPRNGHNIQLILQLRGKRRAVQCRLLPRTDILTAKEMDQLAEGASEMLLDAATLVTTGNVSVAAAAHARALGIEIISNDQLMELLTEDRDIPIHAQFLRWEMTQADVRVRENGGK